MDWIIFGIVVAWLGIISWFDIRKNEIPHSAWVIIPLIGACFYRTWQGDWILVLLSILVAAISERERISRLFGWEEIGKMVTWFPLLFLGVYISVQTSPFAALAIIGFWVAWELKWWGGADAVSAIAICLIWPSATLIIAFLVAHLLVVLGLGLVSVIQKKKMSLHRLPGIPIIFASVIMYTMANIFSHNV
jgi:hypothetical protein